MKNMYSKFNFQNIKDNLKILSSFKSRMTGYPGFYKSAEFIASKFKEYGLEPIGEDGGYYEYFNITVPLTFDSYIMLENRTKIEAYPLYPNRINPSPYTSPKEGDELVYIPGFSIKDFKNIDIRGKFVLMEFNSIWMYRIAMTFGAKGVIYIEPLDTTVVEALTKLYNLPVNFPRLYINRSSGLMLKKLCSEKGSIKVWIKSDMRWKKIRVANIVGMIRGSERPNEAIIISAYYDSWGIVPGISPGATDAIGISSLLEMANTFSKLRPKRSIIFLAIAGHWQALWGAREYVERHFNEIVQKKLRMFISMDITSGSDHLALYTVGCMYHYNYEYLINTRTRPLILSIFSRRYGRSSYIDLITRILGEEYKYSIYDGVFFSYPTYLQNYPPKEFAIKLMDSEPFTLAAFGGGLGFVTIDDVTKYRKTPLDIYENIDFKNVKRQVLPLTGIIWLIVNQKVLPSLTSAGGRFYQDWGYVTLNATMVKYNITTSFFDPVTKESDPEIYREQPIIEIVFQYQGPAVGESVLSDIQVLNYFVSIVDIPDDNGRITIHGLKPYTNAMGYVYVINESNGQIDYALDLGVYTVSEGNSITLTSSYVNKQLPIFRCSTMILYSLINPEDLSYNLNPVPLNHISHISLIRWSSITSPPDYVFFVMPETPVEIIIYSPAGKVYGVLINSTKDNPEGTGYILKPGEMYVVSFTPFTVLKDYYLLTKNRINIALSYSTSNPIILTYDKLATRKFNKIEGFINRHLFYKAYGTTYTAWMFTKNAYLAMMGLIFEVIQTLIFFFTLSLVFMFFLERMTFSYSGPRRIITLIFLNALMLLILVFIHPSFKLATNSIMVLLSFSVVVILSPIVVIIFLRAYSSAKEIRYRVYSIHEIEISRVSLVSTSFSIGLQNLRKRPLRTMLTLISIALVIVALVGLTSITLSPVMFRYNVEVKPAYNGVLLRSLEWAPLPYELYIRLLAEYGDNYTIAPRTWVIPPVAPKEYPQIVITPKIETPLAVMLAISPEEFNVTNLDKILIRGRGFTKGDFYTCLISKSAIESLSDELGRKMDIGSSFHLWGVNITIVGIFDGKLLDKIIDIDGVQITPVELWLGSTSHVIGDNVLIIPFDLAWKLWGSYGNGIASIAIKTNTPEQSEFLGKELAYSIVTTSIYNAKGDKVSIIGVRPWYEASNIQNLIVPLIIAALTITDLMLGAVYERVREISIYSALGLAPLHVAGMFLAEAIALAVLGAFPGYVAGVGMVSLMLHLNVYPPNFYPNLSSIFVIWATSIAILFAILSSLYPSYKASKFSVPSLIRRWKPIRPTGSEWIIPLPFQFEDHEALGVLTFIKEYLESLGGEGTIFKISEIKLDKIERKIDNEVIKVYRIVSPKMRLAPFEYGILQDFVLEAVSRKGRTSFTIYTYRVSGLRDTWIKSNEIFLKNLRKQFLIWRFMKVQQRREYEDKGFNLFINLEGGEK